MADPFIAHEPQVSVAEDGRLLLFVPLVGAPDVAWAGAFGLVGRQVPAIRAEAVVTEEGILIVLPPEVQDGTVVAVLEWVQATIPKANEAWAARQQARQRVAAQVSAWWEKQGRE